MTFIKTLSMKRADRHTDVLCPGIKEDENKPAKV